MTSSKCPYGKCDGKGLLPFVLPDGTISKFAKVFCDCHPVYGVNPELEHFRPVTPEDYDFPMSFDFRTWTYWQSSFPDPMPQSLQATKSPEEPPKEVIHRYSGMERQEFALLQKTSNAVKYLLSKVEEMEKKKAKPKRDYL